MSKVAVVYWSGTGNTQAMAEEVVAGAKESGCDVSIFTAEEFTSDMMDDYDAIAFGCPSMGSEELEDSEFEPMFSSCEPKLRGKKIALFGSYGWGDGEWMRNWVEQMEGAGATVVGGEDAICQEAPDEDAQDELKAMGKQLAAI